MAADATSFFSDARQRAARWLAAWDGQGGHRTATAGDTAGAEWLAREAAALGGEVAIEEFKLDRLDPVAAFLEIRGARIEAVPAFDAPPSEAGGVSGTLGYRAEPPRSPSPNCRRARSTAANTSGCAGRARIAAL